MLTLGYIRVSTDEQDLSKQKHLLLEYAQQRHIIIDQFIEAEVSSRKTPKERRIEELLDLLETGDHLLVAELSRLGRNMLETLNIITTLSDRGIKITFVRQPELSTAGAHGKPLLAIYSIRAIQRLINPLLEKPATYNTFKYFVQQFPETISS